MGANRRSQNSWSFTFRFIRKHARRAAFALLPALFLSPGQSEATTYNWATGYINVGADCINNVGTTCSSAEANCQSYAAAAARSPSYYLTPTDSVRILTCWYTNAVNDKTSTYVTASCPTGFAPDDNTSSGCSPINGAMPNKLIGGSGNNNCQCGAPDSVGNAFGGEPMNIASGNMFYSITDYKTAWQNTLDFTRYYNSRSNALITLGTNWRSTYDRFIWLYSSSFVDVQRADGQILRFTLNGTTWTPDNDVDYKLIDSGSTWTLTTPKDTVETYSNSSAINAAVLNIRGLSR